MSTRTRARLSLLGAAALFSTGGAAIKGTHFGGLELAGLRSGVAVLALLVFLRSARSLPGPRAWLVGLAYAATLGLYVVANKLTTSALAIFLQSTAPIYVLVAAPLLLSERVQRRDLAFLAVAGAGLACLLLEDAGALPSASDPALGNLFALASGATWALTMLGLRWIGRARGSRGSLEAVIAGNSLAALVCLGLAAARSELHLEQAGPASWSLVVYLGVFQIGLAYVLVSHAVGVLEAFEVAVLLLVEPILNPLWAFLVHGERPGPWTVLGGAAILAATLLKSWWDARSEARTAG